MPYTQRMKLAFALPLLAAFALAVTGCQPTESKVPGTWTANGGGSMVISADNKFVMTSGGQPMNGTWSLAEKTVTMKVETVAGKPIKEAIVELENNMYMMPADQAAMTKQILDAMKTMERDGFTGTITEDGKVLTTTAAGATQTWNKKLK